MAYLAISPLELPGIPAPSQAAKARAKGPIRSGLPWPPSLRALGATPHRAGAELLEAAGAGQEDRVLCLGESGAETLCDALHRGCRGASAFREPPAHPDPVEIVVAPAIRSEEAGRAVADCARRALPSGGRLALRLIGEGTAALGRSIASRLRAYGFERVRLRGQAEGALMVYRLASARKGG
ncbi:hypothetical protein [Roseomonas indoligenes]|uniref:Uncharacterized protein n=1 Tax=Roseomonas indoligenes TaxID=2820811 RepID=A0A940MVN8_9PROT|nr:hypothetical protein [Pararoseomonas indoligenes]MBP0492077.1 hypothetical protein [Pararoseomonas indoligenes]